MIGRAKAGLVVIALAGAIGCGKSGGGGDGAKGGAAPGASLIGPLTASPPPAPAPVVPAPPVDVKGTPLSFAPIAKLADKGVVTINTLGEEEDPGFRRRRPARERKGLGTGFIVQKDGVILTNNHVIEGADLIRVKLSDDREFDAKIIGRDAPTDIAVVKIEAQDLSPLPFGESEGLEVGDWVLAIGNPFGLSHTVSAGIVSAKGRTQQDVPLDPAGYYDFLQTDASINPGNSGGPLLNLRGEVVGINTAIRGGGAQGIGFAIPIDMVKKLLPTLLRENHITRSALGVRIRDVRELTNEDRVQLKLVDGAGKALVTSGAVIELIEPGGPADKAALQAGDVIIKFDGQAIDRRTQLQWLASTFGVGKTAKIAVAREGQVWEFSVVLGALQAPTRRAPHTLPPGFPP